MPVCCTATPPPPMNGRISFHLDALPYTCTYIYIYCMPMVYDMFGSGYAHSCSCSYSYGYTNPAIVRAVNYSLCAHSRRFPNLPHATSAIYVELANTDLVPDRPLQHINKKGRPVSQCQHCRAMRKSRSSHAKCDCGEKTHKCAHLQPSMDGHKGELIDLT